MSIVALFVMSAFGAVGNTFSIGQGSTQNGTDATVGLTDGPAMAKMDDATQAIVNQGVKGMTKVIVATTDVGEVADYLRGYEYRGLAGNRAAPGDALTTLTLDVPTNIIDGLSKLPSVYGVYDYPEAGAGEQLLEEKLSAADIAAGDSLKSVYDSKEHNAQEAWIAGYIGTGVNVAIPEGGIDFGHPDLQGTQARVPATLEVIGMTALESASANVTTVDFAAEDMVSGSLVVYVNGTAKTYGTQYNYDATAGVITFATALPVGSMVTVDYLFTSPYAGWPIVFDYSSMSTYLSTGKTTGTWYVSTNETAEKYSTPTAPQLNVELPVVREDAFSSASAASVSSVNLDHGTVKQGSVTVYADDVALGTGFSVNYDLGEITFSPAILARTVKVTYVYYQWDNVPSSQRAILSAGTGYTPKAVGGAESYTVSGLEPSTNYLFSIRATDEANNHGQFSNNPDAVTAKDITAPSQVSDLSASEGALHGQMLLTWTAPGDDGAVGTAKSYVVKYSEDPISNWVCFDYLASTYSQSWTPKAAGTAESHVVSGLTIGTQYYFAIAAVDEGGNQGPVSNTDGAAPKNDITPPAVINPVATTGTNSTQIILDWTASGNDGSTGTATSYELRYSTTQIDDEAKFLAATVYAPSLAWVPKAAGSAESYALTMPLPGTLYYLSLKAVDIAGNKGPVSSPAASATSQSSDVTAPGQITDLVVETGVNHGDVFLNFTAPGDDNSAGWAASYIVKYYTSPIDATNWDTIPEVYGTSGTYPSTFLSGWKMPDPLEGGTEQSIRLGETDGNSWSFLPAGVDYYFAIRASDGVNLGAVSNCDNALVQSDNVKPSVITLNIGQSADHGNVLLDWVSPGDDGMAGTPKQFEIRYSTSAVTDATWDSLVGSSYAINYDQFAEAFGFVPKGGDHVYVNFSANGALLQGVTYYFGIKARDEMAKNNPLVSNSPNGTVRNDNVLPGAITLAAAAATSHGTVSLTWSAPGDDGSIGMVQMYEIRWVKAHYQEDFVDADIKYVGILNPTKIWTTYRVTGINSESGIYRLGTLPDANLATYVNNYSGSVFNYSKLLLVDSVTAGVYDTVYIDLDYDQDFTDEKPCVKGDEISWRDMDGNGLADRSGGMMYYISQADVVTNETLTLSADGLQAELAHANLVNNSWTVYIDGVLSGPGNYTVDFAAGIVKFTTSKTGSVVKISYEHDGLALPYSDRLAERTGVENVIPRNGELVAMYGEYTLDSTWGTSRSSGIVGKAKMSHLTDTSLQPCLGIAPDARIIGITDTAYDGMFFAIEGYDGIPGTGDEADIYSCGLAMASYQAGGDFATYYTDWIATEYGKGKVIFTASSGEDGCGYGTMASPGSAPGVITAGLATDFFYRIAEAQDTGPNPSFGDIVPLSGRGPTIMGNPKPDVVATGAYFNFINEPLWTAYDRGPNAVYTQVINTGQGGGLASSNLAAAIAILADAYDDTHTAPLDTETARECLMSGAEDINYDVLSQGAGFVDVMESVRIATGTGGSTVTPTSWVPGDYNGARYDAYAKLIGEGTLPENLEQTFTVTNTGTSSMDADIFAGEMLKAGEEIITITRDSSYGHGWTILNGTGFYAPDGELLQSLDPTLWTGTDLVRITQYSTSTAQNYWLELYDWTDENSNGKIDGPLNAGPYESSSPQPFAERNRMTAAFVYGNVLTATVHDQSDSSRIHDGICIWTRALEAPADPLDIHIKAEFYSREAWDWVSVSPAALTVPAGGAGTFTATLDAEKAMAAGVGSYEGSITSTSDAGKTTVIPVVVNVAAASPNFEFGNQSLHDNVDNFQGLDTAIAVYNETFTTEGNETYEFYLDNINILNQTYLAIDGTDVTFSPYFDHQSTLGEPKYNDTLIVNEPVGGYTSVYMSHANIVPGTEQFLAYNYGGWYFLGPEWTSISQGPDDGWYTFNYATGKYQWDQSWGFWDFTAGDNFFAWYAYNVTGFTPITNTSWYTVNTATGLVTLDPDIFPNGLPPGTKVHTWYEYQAQQKNFQLSRTNIVSETFEVTEDGTPLSEFTTVAREMIMNNTRAYVNQQVVKAADNVTVAGSLELYEAGYEVGPGTYTLYLDGKEMLEGVDYVLNLQTGAVTFGAPLKWGMEVRANYGTYAVGVTELRITNGNIYDNVKSGSDTLGYQVYRNGNGQTDGIQYFLSKIPVKNETSIIAAGGESSFSLANAGIILTSDNALYLSSGGAWTKMANSGAVGKPNYAVDYASGDVTLNGWTLAAGEKVRSYYNYSGCLEGKVKLNTFNLVSNELSVASAASGQTSFSVFYDNLNDVGATSPNTLYYNDTTGMHKMAESRASGKYNYTMDTITGDVTLSNWSMDAGAKVYAYYNYTGLKSGDIFEIDYSFGRYNYDPIIGKLDFLMPPANGAAINVTYSYYDSDRMYDPSMLFSGFDGAGGRPGDWRFYYVDIPNQGQFKSTQTKLLVRADWWKDKTDVDAFAFGDVGYINTQTGSPFATERYGPSGLQNNGGSTETADVFTASGTSLEYATPAIGVGLNVVAVHAVRMNGTSNIEPISGSVGTFNVDKEKISIVTNELAGSASVTGYSSIETGGYLGGVAAGPSAPTQYRDMLVYQDEADWSLFPTFEAQLASGNTSIYVTLKDCLIFDVHIYGHTDTYTRPGSFNDVGDLDLGVFLDGNGDGITQEDEFFAMCADADADEQVKLIGPPDGDYIIRVYGFTLKSVPAHYDVDITNVQGLGFGVSGEGDDLTPDNPDQWKSDTVRPAFAPSTLMLSYDLPSAKDGVTLQGALYMGPGDAPYTMLMPIELRYDSIAPTVTGNSPMDGTITRDRMPSIAVSFDDPMGELIDDQARLYVDGVDVTAVSAVNIPLVDDDTAPVKGYPTGTITYAPNGPMAEGVHVVKATMGDLAGNVHAKSWNFLVDGSVPELAFDARFAGATYTNAETMLITGRAEAGASLSILGATVQSLERNDDGSFSAVVGLTPGANQVQASAVDAAGNRAVAYATVVYDLDVPEFMSVRFSGGFRTNNPYTTITGKTTEPGTMTANGAAVAVNSDGTFEATLQLVEGTNTVHLVFTDLSGNQASDWENVTLDTAAPQISIAGAATEVTDQNYVLTGTVEPGSELFINGKRIDVGTRQSSGTFTTTLVLSEGLNTIVIEAEDSAGNVAEVRHIVAYSTEGAAGTNWGAIGLMVVLLVVGLLLGMFLGPMLFGKAPEEQAEPEAKDEPAPEAALEEAPAEEELPAEEAIPEVEEPVAEPAVEPVAEPEAAEAVPEPVSEMLAEEPKPEEAPAAEPEDPRIEKLRSAYEAGKISKELYEKNLAKFKGEQ